MPLTQSDREMALARAFKAEHAERLAKVRAGYETELAELVQRLAGAEGQLRDEQTRNALTPPAADVVVHNQVNPALVHVAAPSVTVAPAQVNVSVDLAPLVEEVRTLVAVLTRAAQGLTGLVGALASLADRPPPVVSPQFQVPPVPPAAITVKAPHITLPPPDRSPRSYEIRHADGTVSTVVESLSPVAETAEEGI